MRGEGLEEEEEEQEEEEQEQEEQEQEEEEEQRDKCEARGAGGLWSGRPRCEGRDCWAESRWGAMWCGVHGCGGHLAPRKKS